MSNVEYLYSDIGWASWNRWDVQNDLLPITITQERVTVQARPYDQKWYHHATCTIPAGQTSCTNNWTATMALGTTGYLHDGAMLTNVDGSLRGNPGWANVTWNDRHYPAIACTYFVRSSTSYKYGPKCTAAFNKMYAGANNAAGQTYHAA
jgi:hypothetical protein